MRIKTALVFGMALCASVSASANESSLQIKGSDTMVNLAQAWAEEFMNGNPGSFIAVTGGGSGTGFASLIAGTCDIAMSSREIKPGELEQARAKGVEPKEYKPALDGLSVVVHKDNPVSSLTLDQLADMFTGKITNWKEVGGPDLRIVLLSREVNSGTHVYFKEHVLRHGNSKSKIEFTPKALLMPSSQAIADEAVDNPACIGYFGMGYRNPGLKEIAIAKDTAAPAVMPTVDSVMEGKYPISRPLYLYTNGEPKEAARRFLDFAMSPRGQELVVETDFVPVKKAA